MLNLEWKNEPNSSWPDGPWQQEPVKKQWVDETTGLPCLAVRHPHSGHWCGYVGVGSKHPLYGVNYDEPDVIVHGGLTFSSHCSPEEDPAKGVCHLVELGEDDKVWWLGFDCAHCDDYSPLDLYYNPHRPLYGEYRTLDYVIAECAKLASQLKAME